jgi:hypothetical protein
MSSLLITPKSSEELNFLIALLERLDMKSHLVSEEEIEDLGLSIMMRDIDCTEKVSRAEIMKNYKKYEC